MHPWQIAVDFRGLHPSITGELSQRRLGCGNWVPSREKGGEERRKWVPSRENGVEERRNCSRGNSGEERRNWVPSLEIGGS